MLIRSHSSSMSTDIRQQLTKDDDARALRPHRSLLPLPLYLLSFAEPSHSKTKSPWQDRFTHPYILYVLGTLAAIPAGLAFPAMDMLYGHWTTGVTEEGVTEADIRRTGSQMGWVTTVVGVGVLFFAWVFPICCKSALTFTRGSTECCDPQSLPHRTN
jgi:hypothetical protein